MSDSKISALPVATSVAGTDLTVIVQDGVTKQAAVGLLLAGALLAFNDVADNPSKLALPANTPPGYPVRITGEADRLEVFLGGDITDDASWAVLRNTVNLTVNNQSYNGDETINGIDCPTGVATNVGWVDPTRILGGSGNSRIASVSAPGWLTGTLFILDSLYEGYGSIPGPTFAIPLATPAREANMLITLEGEG